MPSSKFDLAQNMSDRLKPQLRRLNSNDSLRRVLDNTVTPIVAERSDANWPSPTTSVGRGNLSESVGFGMENKKLTDSRTKPAAETVSQRQSDDLRSNCTRKTVILLQSHDNNEHGHSHAKLLEDKGFSRSTHLSVIYGTMLVLFGLAFPVTEALQNAWLTSHVVGVFLAYIFSGGTIFILYLEIYENLMKKGHEKKRNGCQGQINKGLEVREDQEAEATSSGRENNQTSPVAKEADNDHVQPSNVDTSSSASALQPTDSGMGNYPDNTNSMYSMDSGVTDDVYDYITMHHGTATIASGETNYFLKLGLLVFSVANMVYVALRIEGEHYRISCSGKSGIVYPHYVHLVFIIMQTFFLIKTCKRALRTHKPLVNFGLMHLVATNLCVWLRYLVLEVVESIHKKKPESYESEYNHTNCSKTCSRESVMEEAEHYLFPFILEYSLIAMTAMIFMYSNINIRVTGKLYRSICEALHKQRVARAKGDECEPRDYMRTQSALGKSHRGLAMGVVVLAGVVVSIVLFFYWKGAGDIHKAQMCHAISELIILLMFIVNTIVGMCHLYRFIFNPANVNTLDHTLLLISANFLLVLELFVLFSKIGYVKNGKPDTLLVTELVSTVTSMIQAILQVAFVTDGMQRVSVKEEQIREKRGRGVITFLIILNAAMWIFESFQEKYSEQMEEIEMYGEVAWAIISSVSHPLQVFFYFHSSICLAHMWHHCYEEPEDNVMVNGRVI